MRSDLLGPEWTSALARLQDRVPGVPFEQIRGPITLALGEDHDRYFRSLDEEPIAAGSIAQVHGGIRSDGTPVIVKIRRPGIEEVVDADMRILRRIARLAQRASPLARQKPDELLRFFAESLDREMDLGAEARASEEIGAYLSKCGVETARFDDEVTGRSLNVQERVDAIPATDLDALAKAGVDLSAAARAYARAVLSMIIFNGRFHADPHPGNVLIRRDGALVFIDFGAVGTLLPERRDELVRMSLAIAGDDADDLVEVLLHWAGHPPVDREALKAALLKLIRKFQNTLLDQIELSGIFADVFELLRTFQLALPGDLALMLRTLLTAEGFVRRLDPQFDITTELAPIARQLLLERASFATLSGNARRTASILFRILTGAPEIIANLERVGRNGRLPISLDPQDLAQMRKCVGMRARRSMEMIPASLVIAGAILADGSAILAGICALCAVAILVLERFKKT
ncbi:ABC1 kinase family protein [Tsuneonella sp. HG094]